jgi:hypothetical protein
MTGFMFLSLHFHTFSEHDRIRYFFDDATVS